MTDRYNALIVVLDKDIREDDAEVIINAIRQIRHVIQVVGNVSNIEESVAEARVKNELIEQILKILK